MLIDSISIERHLILSKVNRCTQHTEPPLLCRSHLCHLFFITNPEFINMGFGILKSVFMSSLIVMLSLSVGISSLVESETTNARLNSYNHPQNTASSIEVFSLSNSDCESIDLASEIMYASCASTHPNAGSFYAVFDGHEMNYFSHATFEERELDDHAIKLDGDGKMHLAYISKTYVTYGSDPLGAGYEVQAVNYAHFNGSEWENQVVISDSTEERSWWKESFGSLQLAVETSGKVHLTYVHRIDDASITDSFRHWTFDQENTTNTTMTTTPWNGNELSPTFLNINDEDRLFLTYYDNDGLSLMIKNPDTETWLGTAIDIQSDIALPLWSDDRLSFAPHSSALGFNDELHLCYYDTASESLMHVRNATSLSAFASNEAPLQWEITTISSNQSIETGMLCTLEVGLNGDVHLFYTHAYDTDSALLHAVLHRESWYVSELYHPQEDCNQSGSSCSFDSLPIFSESKIFVLSGDEVFQISFDGDYENRTDYDNDGTINSLDSHPFNDSEQSDYDMDGFGDNADLDDDNDGVDDVNDLFPFDELEQNDSDGDGIGDHADLDDDNDGYPDDADAFPMDSNEHNDTDGDGLGDRADTDDDNDGWSDTIEVECMSDQFNASDTPPDLNDNSVCDQIENYTQETELEGETSSNAMLIGTVGVSLLIVSALAVLVLRRGKEEDDDWFEEESEMYNEMTSFSSTPKKNEAAPVEESPVQSDHVDSWEELPDGEWLENDEDGTHWFRAHDGTHWHSTDDGYRVWDES